MGLSVWLAALLPLFFALKLWNFGRREKDLPPGPPTSFILGNALQFPKEFPHLQFSQWAQEYGDIFSLKLLNQTMVVLTSPTAIKAVLDKQGLITGNRPQSHMVDVVEGIYFVLGNMDDHAWKSSRKATHMFLTSEALENHWPTQRAEFAQFLNDVLDSPQHLYTHIKRTTASIIATLVFGKRYPKYEGSEIERYYVGNTLFNQVADPVAHPPIDLIPILKYVPSRWAPWKELCKRTKAVRDSLFSEIFSDCEERLASAKHTEFFIGQVIEKQATLDITQDEIKSLGRIMMDGGAKTSASFLQSMILAMINFPLCQKEAQSEIDRVVGSERLPTLEDLEHLPYVQALIKEVHRFRTILPILLPHSAAKDAIYKDYRIPKGTIIFANVWGIFHDPERFEDAESFKPERYLKTRYGTRTEDDVHTDGMRDNLFFGAGRRICPGAEMASKTVAINTMNLLWAFNFSRDQSGTGNIDLNSYGKPGIELSPKPFTCNATVRHEAKAALIREWNLSLNPN